ncbi:hypothetical protein B0H11DRAFT_2254983 [Mycena galericulata]|nr:hypothetical protein B0H11DRAFT_2254983 [Mycena galericulata]
MVLPPGTLLLAPLCIRAAYSLARWAPIASHHHCPILRSCLLPCLPAPFVPPLPFSHLLPYPTRDACVPAAPDLLPRRSRPLSRYPRPLTRPTPPHPTRGACIPASPPRASPTLPPRRPKLPPAAPLLPPAALLDPRRSCLLPCSTPAAPASCPAASRPLPRRFPPAAPLPRRFPPAATPLLAPLPRFPRPLPHCSRSPPAVRARCIVLVHSASFLLRSLRWSDAPGFAHARSPALLTLFW